MLAHPRRAILLTSNDAAGRGVAGRFVQTAVGALRDAGHQVTHLPVDRSDAQFGARLRDELSRAEVFVAAGGDGTIHHALPALLETGTPMYHLPFGTENLFARHFGMRRDARQLVESVRAFRVVPIDGASVRGGEGGDGVGSRGGGEPATVPAASFAIMCSIGPDGSVVHRLADIRRGPISHLSYTRPILAEFFSPRLPVLSVTVDGTPLVQERRGLLVIANSPQYAVRINPARTARIDDGALDVVFFPADTGVQTALWLGAARLGMHMRSPAFVAPHARGQTVVVRTWGDEPGYAQFDGERGPIFRAHPTTISVRPGALRVLTPARS